MGAAQWPPMHALLFRLKRAFHRSLAHVRPLIAEFGLTPARFDMMKVIQDGSSGHFVRQSSIRRALGVSAPTVSRMLKSLETLGLVVRMAYCDKRERLVALTDEGRRRFDAAVLELLLSGAMDLSFAGALTSTDDWPHREEHARQALARLDSIREGFRDRAEDYLYRVTRWFCPGHFTQRRPDGAFYEKIEADDCAGIDITDRLMRDPLASVPPY